MSTPAPLTESFIRVIGPRDKRDKEAINCCSVSDTMKKFKIIYLDPPWKYADKGCNGAAERQYPTMSIPELKALKVGELSDTDCVMFMWATWPLLPEALDLIKAYGFSYVSVAFVWIKTNKRAEVNQYRMLPEDSIDTFYGLGRWTRGNTEMCLLAKRGKPKRVSNSVQQIIYAPIGRHSEKPAETRDRIVELIGDVPRIELFARKRCPGWEVFGNEVESSVKL